jgi:hypothetical protein
MIREEDEVIHDSPSAEADGSSWVQLQSISMLYCKESRWKTPFSPSKCHNP